MFEETSRAYVTKSFGKGDMVRAAGTIRQNSYEKDGERRYTTDLVIDEISRAPLKKAEAPADEPTAGSEPERQVAGSKARGRKAS